jgi:hypothetical protein
MRFFNSVTAATVAKDRTMNSAAGLPAKLPDISSARLPATYKRASTAIAECSRIDECRGWADKAAALASYARQAKDDTLRVMAVRIQARAMRRCGELLKQIEPQPGKRTDKPNDGTVTRSEAAEHAGLSERQKVTALRVASVSSEKFEQQVENPAPPTVTQLAEQGKQSRALETSTQSERFKATCTALHAFVKFCDAHEAAETARTFEAKDAEMARKCVATLDQWLDRFVTTLPEENVKPNSAGQAIA